MSFSGGLSFATAGFVLDYLNVAKLKFLSLVDAVSILWLCDGELTCSDSSITQAALLSFPAVCEMHTINQGRRLAS